MFEDIYYQSIILSHSESKNHVPVYCVRLSKCPKCKGKPRSDEVKFSFPGL